MAFLVSKSIGVVKAFKAFAAFGTFTAFRIIKAFWGPKTIRVLSKLSTSLQLVGKVSRILSTTLLQAFTTLPSLVECRNYANSLILFNNNYYL